MQKMPTLLVALRHSPWSGHWFVEGLDAALVGAVFGQKVQLLFLDHGAMGLIKNHDGNASNSPRELAVLENLEMYGIEEVMVPEADFNRLGLSQYQLIDGVNLIDNVQLRTFFSNADHVLNF